MVAAERSIPLEVGIRRSHRYAIDITQPAPIDHEEAHAGAPAQLRDIFGTERTRRRMSIKLGMADSACYFDFCSWTKRDLNSPSAAVIWPFNVSSSAFFSRIVESMAGCGRTHRTRLSFRRKLR